MSYLVPASGKLFISYAHEDASHAYALKETLEGYGFEVWWDPELMASDVFRVRIGEFISDAAAVVVIWSEDAIRSHWVREEALSGIQKMRLISTCVEGFDKRKIPYGYRELDTFILNDGGGILEALGRIDVRIDKPVQLEVAERPIRTGGIIPNGKIFISYTHKDKVQASQLRDRLIALGYDVWWDEELTVNDAFRIRVGATIPSSAAVIVIWSDNAIESKWVKDEVLKGIQNDKLISTCARGFNRGRIPYGSREINTDFVDEISSIIGALSRLGVHGDAPAQIVPNVSPDALSKGKVFISYAHEDASYASKLRDDLYQKGYDVWWDEELIANEAFRIRIGQIISDAAAVIVVWSEDSIKSHWVREEALSGLQGQRLISTCVPGFSYERIPHGYRQDGAFLVDEIPRIQANLAGLGLRVETPDIPQTPLEPQSAGQPVFERELVDQAPAIHPRSSGGMTPLIGLGIFIFTFAMGFTVVIAAVYLRIAFVDWVPLKGADYLDAGSKQVGFLLALNWSLTATFLMPLAWTVIFLTLAELNRVVAGLTRRGMILDEQFRRISPDNENLNRLRRDVRRFVLLFMGFVTVLALAYSALDFKQVVWDIAADTREQNAINTIVPEARNGDDGKPIGYKLDDDAVERDWSIAAYLNRSDTEGADGMANTVFSGVVYLIYAGIGVGSLFSFMFVLFGVGGTFQPGVLRNYGLVLIPDLNSADKRRGFEVLQTFTTYVLSVLFIVMVFCYLMSTQNIYLRAPDPTLFHFLMPDFATALDSDVEMTLRIDALVGYSAAGEVPSLASQNVFIWIIAPFVVMGFLGGFFLVLKQSAENGRDLVLNEIDTVGLARLRRITNLRQDEISGRLEKKTAWPLKRLSIGVTLLYTFVIVAGFVFYKLGFVIIAGFILLGVRNLVNMRTDRRGA